MAHEKRPIDLGVFLFEFRRALGASDIDVKIGEVLSVQRNTDTFLPID